MSEEGKVVKMANSGVSATSKEVQLLELTPAKEECGLELPDLLMVQEKPRNLEIWKL